MKKTIDIELEDEDIAEQLKYAISELYSDKISDVIASRAKSIVDKEIMKQIGPLVEATLNGAKFTQHFGFYYSEKDETADKIIEKYVVEYLNQRVYTYSRDNDTVSGRFMKTSDSSRKPTRLEAFLQFSIERYIDAHIMNKMEAITKEFIEQRGGIEEVAKQKMSQLLKGKFGL